MVRHRLCFALGACAAVQAFAPTRPHATRRRVARHVATLAAGPPTRWCWSGPVVQPAPALATPAAATPAATGAQKRLVFLLAFCAGLADLVLVRKHGCFATMMTGNLIKGITAGIDARWADAAFFASMVTVYLSGVGAFRVLDERFGRDRSPRVNRVLAPAVLFFFVGADAFGHDAPRAGALWCAAGFGLVNSVSLDVLLTITCMLTVHMHKLTNLAVDFAGLAGREARARAKVTPVNKRSITAIGAFGLGVAAGVVLFAAFPGFVARGFQTALGLSYFCILLSHDRGRLRRDMPGRTLLGGDHPPASHAGGGK